MSLQTKSLLLGLSLLIALAAVQPALAMSAPPQAAANLSVNLFYTPSTLTVGTHTTGSYSIGGGTPPFTIWMNNTPSGCYPPGNPFTTSNASGTFDCVPTGTGNYMVTVSVHDSAGNSGSTSATLTVNSNTGGGGGGTGGNNTGGFNLSGLTDMFGVLLTIVVVFLACTVAIAASAVALAILVPRRLKQIRKAIEGEPLKKNKAMTKPADEPVKPEVPTSKSSEDEL